MNTLRRWFDEFIDEFGCLGWATVGLFLFAVTALIFLLLMWLILAALT